jgi:hypothetical protein
LVTLKSTEDLEGFFDYVRKKKIETPKLYIEPLDTKSSNDNIDTLLSKVKISQSVVVTPTSTPTVNRGRINTMPVSISPSESNFKTTNLSRVRKWQKGNMLGAGAFGKVYLGMNMETGELMAVKEVDVGGKCSEEQIKSLEREIELLSTLSHPNIVRYLGSQKTDKLFYIFLDYIPGGSVESILGEFTLKEGVIARYTAQILEGLAYLHDNGIIHRDIKCGNILLHESGKAYLSDFGTAKRFSNTLSSNKSLAGTPNYMAPELIKGGQPSKYVKYLYNDTT